MFSFYFFICFVLFFFVFVFVFSFFFFIFFFFFFFFFTEAKKTGKLNLASRAVDSSCSSQPQRTDLCWNIRGVLNNSWHQVIVPVHKDDE